MKKFFLTLVALACCMASHADWIGSGTHADPYIIANIDDLNHLAADMGTSASYLNRAHFLLTNDITGFTTPMGTQTFAFNGTFDGGGHTITVDISATNYDYAGLFAVTENATIVNLTVDGAVQSDANHVGGIVGYSKGYTTVKNCISKATVKMMAKGLKMTSQIGIGGIVGQADSQTRIEDCRLEGTVNNLSTTGQDVRTGGIVGWCKNSYVINSTVWHDPAEQSDFTFYFSTNYNYKYAGGIVGYLEGNQTTTATVINCVNWARVFTDGTSYNSNKQYCGNIVGYVANQYANVDNSFWYKKHANLDNQGAGSACVSGAHYNMAPITTPMYDIDESVTYYANGTNYDYADEALAAYCDSYGYTELKKDENDTSRWMLLIPAYYPVQVKACEGAKVYHSGFTYEPKGSAITIEKTLQEGYVFGRHDIYKYVGQANNQDLYELMTSGNSFTMPDAAVQITPHVFTHTDGVAATCTENGSAEHYHCTSCNADYTSIDEATALDNLVVKKLGHDLSAVASVASTCTEPGNIRYHHCNRCGKNYQSSAATTELDDVVIPATGHELIHFDTFPVHSSGNMMPEFYNCERCGHNYTNQTATNEITTIAIGSVLKGSGNATPYEIGHYSDLLALQRIYKYFGRPFYNTSAIRKYKITNDFTIAESYTPIGDKNYSFVGKIDGGGHTITFEKVPITPIDGYVGLFGMTGKTDKGYIGVEINDLTLKGSATVTGENSDKTLNVGAFHGCCYMCTLTNCRNELTIDCGTANRVVMGGLVGDSTWPKFNNCSNVADINVVSKSCHIGGLIGNTTIHTNQNCQIFNSFNTGNINYNTIVNNDASKRVYVGGICGSAIINDKLANCYNTGNINVVCPDAAAKTYIGGIVGDASPYYSETNVYLNHVLNMGMITVNANENAKVYSICHTEATEGVSDCYYLNPQPGTYVPARGMPEGLDPTATYCKLVDLFATAKNLKTYVDTDGYDLIDLLNADRGNRAEWAYDVDDRPCFAWQTLDTNGDRVITIEDLTNLINAMKGDCTLSHADENGDGVHTDADLQHIVNALLHLSE